MKTIIVDPGKNSVKSFCFNEGGVLQSVNNFPSKTSEMLEERLLEEDASLRQYRVELDGTSYLVGEGVDSLYNSDLTKNNLHHKLCVYAAIADYVESPEEEIRLVVGYPSTDFQNNARRRNFADLLVGKNKGLVEFKCNDEKVSFNITEIMVLPEGQAMLPRMAELDDDFYSLYVLDIGGQNVNFREFDDKGNVRVAFSIDAAGVNYLERKVELELRRAIENPTINFRGVDYNQAIKDLEIKNIGSIEGYDDTTSFLFDVVKKFIKREIIDELASRSYNVSVKGQHVIFTGGGSLLLQPYLEDLLISNKNNIIFSKSAQWDNCLSYSIRAFQNDFKTNEEFADFINPIYLDAVENGLSDYFKENNEVEEMPVEEGQFDFNKVLK